MRLSRYFLPILRETPKEAEIVSHRLMLRAGMIRQEAAGIYAWLPLGFRVLKKIEQIVREEQDRAGAVELLMPTLQLGRPLARERPLRRLRPGDAAHQGPARARDAVRADQRGDDHRDLPRLCALLQAICRSISIISSGSSATRQRPRFGVMRGREFLMKDAYSFDLDEAAARALLQQDVRRLSAHLRAHGAEGDPDARRDRPDRRRSQPRVHHPGGDRRDARSSATATVLDLPVPGDGRRLSTTIWRCRHRQQWTSLYAATEDVTTPHASNARCRRTSACTTRGIEVGQIFYFGTKYSEPMKAVVTGADGVGAAGPRRLLRRRRRRGWSPPSSRPPTTMPASTGRRRSRRSRSRSSI